MSARALNWAWQQSPPTASQKLVLAVLADRADDEGFCYPSIKWIAVKCAPMPERTVRWCITELCKAELLVKVERRRRPDGTLGAWTYRLGLESTSGNGWPLDEVEPVAMGCRTEPSIENTGTDVPVQAADSSEKLGPVGRDHKRVQDLWDACEAFVQNAPTAKSPRAAYAKLVREMDAAGWTPEMVRVRAKAYRRHHTLGKTMLTLPALAKWGEEVDRRSNGLARTPVAESEWGEVEVLPAEENARRMRELVAQMSGATKEMPE